jgi:peptidoglycan/xylan/chitin deacetylase (PgdA/CDA1 family)
MLRMRKVVLLLVLILLTGCATPFTDNDTNSGAERPQVTFVVNTHEWYYLDIGAGTLTHLLDLFENYGVRAEFYFTAPTFKLYEEYYPDVLQRMHDLNMTISFHIRNPHPITFETEYSIAMESMSHEELVEEFRKYETYALDMTTGLYDESQPGGYSYMKEKLGYAPPVAGISQRNKAFLDAELEVLQEMGLQMYIVQHTGETLRMTSWGILSRPSAFAVEKADGEPWWKENEKLDPAELFAEADDGEYGVVLIHDSDFYSTTAGWGQVYRSPEGKENGVYDLNRSDPSLITLYSTDHIAQMWENYEAMLVYATKHFDVVTSVDIIADYSTN